MNCVRRLAVGNLRKRGSDLSSTGGRGSGRIGIVDNAGEIARGPCHVGTLDPLRRVLNQLKPDVISLHCIGAVLLNARDQKQPSIHEEEVCVRENVWQRRPTSF